MKTIDIKSLIIGALLTSTIFLGVAATSPTDKWDMDQQWEIGTVHYVSRSAAGARFVLKRQDEPRDPKALFDKEYYSKTWPSGWEPVMQDGRDWRVRRRIK